MYDYANYVIGFYPCLAHVTEHAKLTKWYHISIVMAWTCRALEAGPEFIEKRTDFFTADTGRIKHH